MTLRRPSLIAAALALLSCLGCSAASPEASSAARWGASITAGGQGDFVFDSYEPLAERPVRVYYQAPPDSNDLDAAEVVVVIPGTGRNAEDYREEWAGLAREQQALLLVPEFSEDEFPGSAAYNVGNVVDEDGDPVDEREWTFQVVEALFRHVVDDLDLTTEQYALFGHSAGAQFVHRMVMLMPEASIRVAVAANAGWYTMPDDDVPFPYGLEDGPGDVRLARAFRVPLVVLLGGDDIDPDADNLRQDAGASAQGENRLTRGLTFFAAARDAAEDGDEAFEWGLTVVPGVGHESDAMAQAAGSTIFPD